MINRIKDYLDDEIVKVGGSSKLKTEDFKFFAVKNEKHTPYIRMNLELIHNNSLEYGNPKSRTHIVGGDEGVREKEIAKVFLKLENVSLVYVLGDGNEDFFTLVLKDDQDDISFIIAEKKLPLTRKYRDYYFEVNYILEECTQKESIPSNARVYTRG